MEDPDLPMAEATVFIDNDRSRVTRWHFAPGAQTGWHRHEYDYVVVPTMDGRVRIVAGAGEESEVEMTSGAPYFREAGVEHNVINANESDYAFIEVEIKQR